MTKEADILKKALIKTSILLESFWVNLSLKHQENEFAQDILQKIRENIAEALKAAEAEKATKPKQKASYSKTSYKKSKEDKVEEV